MRSASPVVSLRTTSSLEIRAEQTKFGSVLWISPFLTQRFIKVYVVFLFHPISFVRILANVFKLRKVVIFMIGIPTLLFV